MRRVFHIFLLLSAFLFFWNTDIANHTEADDAFEYAAQVEDIQHPWLYHPHHLAYGVIAKKAYHAIVPLGYPGRAYDFLVLLSSLAAAGSVYLFYRFCYRRYSMRPVSSLFAAGFMAVSYGFWRYACEAEVMLPAAFFALLAMYLATAPASSLWMVVYAAGVAAVSVLFHIMNGVPVFVAIPLFYLLSRQPRRALLHVLVAGGLVTAAYAWVYTFRPSVTFIQSVPSLMDRLDWSLVTKSMVGFGQCLVSGNFLFGYDKFAEWLTALFPYRMFAEEIYMGHHMSVFQRIAPAVTLSLLVLSAAYGLLRAFASWKREFRLQKLEALHMVGGWQTLAVVALWFVIYAMALLVLEPGNPEVWVLGLVPFWLLACGLVIAPLARANELWVALAMLALLGVHNGVGGIGLLRDASGDYNVQKAAWVVEHATGKDCIVAAGNPVFMRYLKYHTPACVVDLNRTPAGSLDDTLSKVPAVYVLNDVFEYPLSMRKRFPGSEDHVDAFASQLRPHVVKVVDNQFGGVWKYISSSPDE
jgi:hypothetical protein